MEATAKPVADQPRLLDIGRLPGDLAGFRDPVWHRGSGSGGESNTTKRGEGDKSYFESHWLSPSQRLQNVLLVQWLQRGEPPFRFNLAEVPLQRLFAAVQTKIRLVVCRRAGRTWSGARHSLGS
jgi:hypothetical protein